MIDLALIKQQLRVQHDLEDDLLDSYLKSAVAHVEQHCDRKIVEAPGSEDEMAMTPDVTQSILLLIGHWYANREAVVTGAVPSAIQLGVDRLLWYRKRF